MTGSRSRRLDAMRRDLDRLTSETEALAQSLEEDAVGAELLASRDLVANLGIAWETLEQIADLYGRQARYLVEDHLQTWSALFSGDSHPVLPEVLGDHLDRRVRHVTEGIEQGIEVVSSQSERAWGALTSIWAPFLAVVRQDWQRRGSPMP